MFCSTQAAPPPHLVLGRWVFVLSVLVVFLLSSDPRPVSACNPTAAPPGSVPPTPIPLAQTIATANLAATIIVEGRVDLWPSYGSYGIHTIVVHVDRYFKGQGPATIQITEYKHLCGPAIPIDEQVIVFADGAGTTTQPFRHQEWFRATDEIRNTVITLVGHGPTISRVIADSKWIAGWFGLLLTPLLLVIWLIWRRRASR